MTRSGRNFATRSCVYRVISVSVYNTVRNYSLNQSRSIVMRETAGHSEALHLRGGLQEADRLAKPIRVRGL